MPVLIVRGADNVAVPKLRTLRQTLKDVLANFKPLGLEGPEDVEVYYHADILAEQEEICIAIVEMWKKAERDKKMQDRVCTAVSGLVREAVGGDRRVFCYVDDLFDAKTQGHHLIEAGG